MFVVRVKPPAVLYTAFANWFSFLKQKRFSFEHNNKIISNNNNNPFRGENIQMHKMFDVSVCTRFIHVSVKVRVLYSWSLLNRLPFNTDELGLVHLPSGLCMSVWQTVIVNNNKATIKFNCANFKTKNQTMDNRKRKYCKRNPVVRVSTRHTKHKTQNNYYYFIILMSTMVNGQCSFEQTHRITFFLFQRPKPSYTAPKTAF